MGYGWHCTTHFPKYEYNPTLVTTAAAASAAV